jgi:Mycotoxin biosynthesis protein UstYa
MCDADVGMFGFNWVKNKFGPHANFNVQHQCRDYEQVLRWADEHQADPGHKHPSAFLRPAGHPTVNYEESPHDPFVEGDAEVTT